MTATPTLPPTDRPGAGRSPARRSLLLLASVPALAAAYLGLVAASGDGLPRGTTVLGVDVGGQGEEEAAATLAAALGPMASAALDAVIGTEHVAVVPEDAGLRLDPTATVAGRAGRSWNPVELVSRLAGGESLAPAVAVDRDRLAATVRAIAADADTAAVEPVVRVTGVTTSLVPGRVGRVVDQGRAVDALASAYLASADPVVLPVVAAPPKVGDGAAQRALDTARSVLAGPVTVRAAGVTATLPPAALGKALRFTPAGGELVASLDGDVLRAAVAPALASVESPGRDASFRIVGGRPVVVPSQVGRGVDADLLAQDVLTALGSGRRTVDARVGTIQPALTTEAARALGVTELMSSFTQRFPYAAYRVQNIGTAARTVDGTLLRPGEAFSLNKILGERTVANGYTAGYVIGPGGVFREDLGGGVSTSATAIWTAAFYAGLERVHTQAHSIWIPRYRAGLEATVAWGSFDMSFRNDTPHGVLITTVMRNTSLTVQVWGTKVYDEVRAVSCPRYDVTPPPETVSSTDAACHAQSGQSGFTIDVDRVFVRGGAEVRRETITTRYRPSPTVVCRAAPSTPTASPTSSKSPSSSPTPSASPAA